jgi:hypothetical protein
VADGYTAARHFHMHVRWRLLHVRWRLRAQAKVGF